MRYFLAYLTFSMTILLGQTSNYSAYGFGMECNTQSVRSMGIGYTGSAVKDSVALNSLNPALWTGFFTTSLSGQINSDYLMSSGDYTDSYLTKLNGFTTKFPVGEYLGVAIGIVPRTRINSVGSTLDSVAFYDNFVNYESIMQIKGGISEIFFGAGYQISPQISVGLKNRLFFGEFVTKINSDFDLTGNLDSQFQRRTKVKASQLGIGVAWHNINKSMGAAAYFNKNLVFKYKHVEFFEAGPEYTYDEKTAEYPDFIRLGLYKSTPSKINFTVDFEYSFISSDVFNDFYFIKPIDAKNFSYFGMGVEKNSINNTKRFLNKLSYRAGLYYKSYPISNPDNLKETGVSIGLGIPFYQNLNRIDISLSMANRNGFIENYEEKVISLNIGVTTGGLWFRSFRRY